MADTTAVEILLEKMLRLINCNNRMLHLKKDQLQRLYEGMQFLREFLRDTEKRSNGHEQLKVLIAKIRDVTCELEDIIDMLVLNSLVPEDKIMGATKRVLQRINNQDEKIIAYLKREKLDPPSWQLFKRMVTFGKMVKSYMAEKIAYGLGGLAEEINSIKTEVMEINRKKMNAIGSSCHGASSRASSVVEEEEMVVGLDDDTTTIIELLTGEHEKQLKAISILGMPGIGKTTLAKKVYNHSFIEYHFYIRGWTYVSQVFQKRDLLLNILCSAFQCGDEIFEMDDEKLGEKLYKHLKGRRYLIVMDDIWNVEAWEHLKRYCPDDNNGSRIMFTSRNVDVILHAKPYFLSFLKEEESWELLQWKIFQKQSCPPELIGIGKQIIKKCQGLPLAIIVISGILAKTKRKSCGNMLLKV